MKKHIITLIILLSLILPLSSLAGTSVVTVNSGGTMVYPTTLNGNFSGGGSGLSNVTSLGILTAVVNFSGDTNFPTLVNLTTNLDTSKLFLLNNNNSVRFTFSCVVTNPIAANTPFLQITFPETPSTTNALFMTQTIWHCSTGDQPTVAQAWNVNVHPSPSSNSITFYTGGVTWSPSTATNIVSISVER